VLAKCKTTILNQEVTKGILTVATTSGYTPWFVNTHQSNGKGYESAVAYAIATELGVKKKDVKWVVEPFDSSYPRARRRSISTSTKSRTPPRGPEW